MINISTSNGDGHCGSGQRYNGDNLSKNNCLTLVPYHPLIWSKADLFSLKLQINFYQFKKGPESTPFPPFYPKTIFSEVVLWSASFQIV